jgi:hypothetical protein
VTLYALLAGLCAGLSLLARSWWDPREVMVDRAAGHVEAQAAATNPKVIAATTPDARVDAATDLLRKRATADKIKRQAGR